MRARVGTWLRRHPAGMRALQLSRVLGAPREFWTRRSLAAARGAGPAPRLHVDPRLGYRLVRPDELPGLAHVLQSAADVHARLADHIPAILNSRSGKHRLVWDLLSDAELAARPELVEFALQQDLVDAAVAYLRTVPILRRVGLGLSSPDPAQREPMHSQRYHLDGEDFSQLKLLINVWPVGEADGPFTFASAPATERVLRRVRFDLHARISGQRDGGTTSTPRYSDEEVHAQCGPDDVVRLVGPPGSAVLVDTSRCLHFGSRLAPGRRRLVLGLVYQRYHLINESPHNVIDPAPHARDRLRTLLLRPPRARPAGFYYPDPLSSARAGAPF